MGKLITVMFRLPHPEFAYFAGQSGKIDAGKAQKLLQEGYIIIPPEIDDKPLVDPKQEKMAEITNTLPGDFPARIILFEAGFSSVEKVVEAGESLVDIDGVGKGTLRQIAAWCKKNR